MGLSGGKPTVNPEELYPGLFYVHSLLHLGSLAGHSSSSRIRYFGGPRTQSPFYVYLHLSTVISSTQSFNSYLYTSGSQRITNSTLSPEPSGQWQHTLKKYFKFSTPKAELWIFPPTPPSFSHSEMAPLFTQLNWPQTQWWSFIFPYNHCIESAGPSSHFLTSSSDNSPIKLVKALPSLRWLSRLTFIPCFRL